MSVDTPTDGVAGADTLWMVCRPKVGDVLVKWRDLTDAECREAGANHNALYGITEAPCGS